MATSREGRWSTLRDYAGGLIMFATEALIVLGLALVAWAFSLVILAFF